MSKRTTQASAAVASSSSSAAAGSSAAAQMNPNTASVFYILGQLWQDYQTRTPKKIKVLDLFLLYVMLVGAVQFAYVLLVGTFPFNAFLAGFITCAGLFVLTVSLRKQYYSATRDEFKTILPERAYAHYILASIVLFLAACVYMN